MKDSKQYRWQRNVFAIAIFGFMCFWSMAILIMVALSGSQWFPFRLSDAVLITMLGTTMIEVILLFGIVAKHLFPPKNKD